MEWNFSDQAKHPAVGSGPSLRRLRPGKIGRVGRQVLEPPLAFDEGEEAFGLPLPLGRGFAELADFAGVAAVLQPVPVSERRPYPWVPDVLRTQQLDF
jgi:hypothetical protein